MLCSVQHLQNNCDVRGIKASEAMNNIFRVYLNIILQQGKKINIVSSQFKRRGIIIQLVFFVKFYFSNQI